MPVDPVTRLTSSSGPDCDRGDQIAVIAAEPWLGGDLSDGQARSGQHVIYAGKVRHRFTILRNRQLIHT